MSTIRVNAIQDTAGVERYTARAWVNFNGTGTVAIRAAGNVSSITDNGVGDYTVNFTNAMPDANYAICGASEVGGGVYNYVFKQAATTYATSSVRINTGSFNTINDAAMVNVAIFR